jgi:Family of unknown function (DUF5681)
MTRNPPRRPGKDERYEVGYGKPPKHTQFKPGQSGNRKGRPRGQRNFRTAVRDALQEKVIIREGDRTRSVSRMDAIIRVTFNNALKSDAKALAAFIQLARSAGLLDEEPELSSAESVSAEDEAVVAGFLERHGLKPRENPAAEAEDVSARPQKKKKPEDKR